MDWLAARQEKIQGALAARHLARPTLVLYDVSSAAFEGRTCPPGAIGHPKDGVRGRLQIVYGLLTSKDGVPVAIEVFEGNTGDPKTVASQVSKLTDRFGLVRMVLVGDRGMLTAARLREDAGPAGLDWITALRAPQVKALVRDGALQLSLFDQMDLAEISSPEYPGERLVACKNPFLEAERARKRESLLAATEADLAKIAAAVARERRPLRGTGQIALRADRVLRRRKVTKHFTTSIGDEHFSYHRNQGSITAEAALDGIYVLRTSVEASGLGSGEVVSSYKALAQVERAFRALNTDLDIRPIPTWTSGPSGTAPRPGSARTCSCGCCRTTSPGTCTTAPRRCCSPTTTRPLRKPPAPPRRPGRPLPAGLGQSRRQAHRGQYSRAQPHQPAGRPGHHLPQPDPARRPGHARLPARHHTHAPAAPSPRPARRQPPPRDRVVRTPPRTTHKPQVNGQARGSHGGTSG
jgi:hypothetical protein